jgi:hypothetical protein
MFFAAEFFSPKATGPRRYFTDQFAPELTAMERPLLLAACHL